MGPMPAGSLHPGSRVERPTSRHEAQSGEWGLVGFRLLDIGHHRRKDWRDLSPHGRTLPVYGLFLFPGGRGRWATRTSAGAIGVGDALLLRPGEWHRFDPDPGTHLEEWWALFDGPLAEQLVRELAGKRNHWQPMDAAALYARCAGILVDATPRTDAGASRATAQLLALLIAVIGGPPSVAAEDAVARWEALGATRAHEVRPPLEEFLASERLSLEAFRKRCQRGRGRGPVRLWNDARLARARDLLTGTAQPIAEIGRRLGFTDRARFSQWCRRLTGASPSGLRQRGSGRIGAVSGLSRR